MDGTLALGAAAVAAAAVLPKAQRRLALSLAKHRSLTGHARMAQRVARWLPGYAYDEARFFACDGAPDEVVAQRRAGLARLASIYRERYPQTLALSAETAAHLPDLQLTGAYRVPFQFAPVLRQHLKVGSFMARSEGHMLTDLDGNRFVDLTGSYGVNLFGLDVYKACIAEGSAQVAELGPLLGSLHPVVARNVERLRRISGQDAVSFHMSGTEAVMQAVRLARYHTKKRYLVRFSGAYHGWWDDVQPGPGNPMPPGKVYTLQEMSEATLRVLRKRRDIACVLVNPLQALHPNQAAPGDSSLVDGSRRAGFDKAAYTAWLQQLREVCTQRGIVLIMDEVFMGFRLAPGGAQEYFGIKADLVTYGKTLGGGLPVGVVCGRADLMKRYRDDRPADLCFARGTFNAHPYVMGAMSAFLDRLQTPALQASYRDLNAVWNARAARMNQALQAAGLPLRVTNLTSVWTVTFTQPSRYHWLLQYYLRAAGIALSWVGSGRLIFTHDFDDAAFDDVVRRFVEAGRAMAADGWWWRDDQLTDRAIRRGILRELLQARFGRFGSFGR